MNPAAFASLPNPCELGAEGPHGPDRITRQSYDAAGQLLKVEKGYGTALRQDYASYGYSANGKRISVTDANGNLVGLAYNPASQIVRRTPSNPGSGPGQARAYAWNGHVNVERGCNANGLDQYGRAAEAVSPRSIRLYRLSKLV